ncbi:MAG: glycosyltransferase involved in cell wall biosynthesis [Hyphomicrobiaceae bacterium]|jgi:glycosyltransferase involved in cell wall biosynthesis
MRVAFLTNVLSPYRVPLFEKLAETTGWDLRVFVNAGNEFDRSWHDVKTDVAVQPVRTLTIRRKVRTLQPVACEQVVELHMPYGLGRSLRQFAPDVVISLELGPRSIAAAAYCERAGIPLIVWSYQSRAAATMTGWLRRMARRFIMSRTKAFVGMGTQAREVLLHAGVKADRIFDAPNAADQVSIEQRLADPETAVRAAVIRQQFRGDRIIVVIGRLVPMKAAPEIVALWRSLDSDARAGWKLVFVGDGPLAHAVRGLEHEGIHHTGHVPTECVTDWLVAADLHLFASLVDVWGLVVSEAMLCGTPTLCSIHAGCSDDVIEDCVDGWLFDPINVNSWRHRLSGLLQNDDLAQFGARARISSRRFGIDRMASGFRMAVRAVAGRAAY